MNADFTELKEKVSSLYAELRESDWQNHSAQTILHELEQADQQLGEIRDMMQDRAENPKIAALLVELEKTHAFINRNIDLERGKGLQQLAHINETEMEWNPEHFKDMQRKLIALSLKAKLLLSESAEIETHEKHREGMEHSSAHSLAELLDQREQELLDLQKDFHQLKRESHVGLVQQKTLIEAEEELEVLRSTLEKNLERMKERFDQYTKEVMGLQRSFFEIKKEKNRAEFSAQKYAEKSAELLRMIKKERDYARKVVMESLPENMKMRKMYAREIMKLERERAQVKKDQEEKFGRALEQMRKEIREKEHLSQYFRELATKKDKEVAALEEDNEKLRVGFKTREKHERVLRAEIQGLQKHVDKKYLKKWRSPPN